MRLESPEVVFGDSEFSENCLDDRNRNFSRWIVATYRIGGTLRTARSVGLEENDVAATLPCLDNTKLGKPMKENLATEASRLCCHLSYAASCASSRVSSLEPSSIERIMVR